MDNLDFMKRPKENPISLQSGHLYFISVFFMELWFYPPLKLSYYKWYQAIYIQRNGIHFIEWGKFNLHKTIIGFKYSKKKGNSIQVLRLMAKHCLDIQCIWSLSSVSLLAIMPDFFPFLSFFGGTCYYLEACCDELNDRFNIIDELTSTGATENDIHLKLMAKLIEWVRNFNE